MNKIPSVILFTGFLGSGKTSFLLKEVKELSSKGIKCAVIENEAGETGVDQLILKKNGLQVRELFGGCICCSLTVNLKETIILLKKDYEFDVLMLEPSGIANVNPIIDALFECGYHREEIHNIMILDALRIGMLKEVLAPLTKETIVAANEIIISKSDLASEEQMQIAYDLVAANRSDITPVIQIGRQFLQINEFIAFAKKIELKIRDSSFDAKKWERLIVCVMTLFMELVQKHGEVQIGHVKSVLDLDHGYIKSSCIGLQYGVQVDKEMEPNVVCNTAKLTFNSIIYGITLGEMQHLFDAVLIKTIDTFGLEEI